MSILELINEINLKLNNINTGYENLNNELKDKFSQAVKDLTDLINSKTLTSDDVKEIINEVAPNLVVKEALNAKLLEGLNIEQLKKVILPNDDIVDFRLVENGARIRYSYDPIGSSASKDGYELFCPHSREEYELARRYLLALGKPTAMGPLGIYYDGNDIPGRCCTRCWHSNIPLNSEGMGRKGWKVIDGSNTWWASDRTDVTEPNGDYEKYAYLGIWYNENGYVKWYNDCRNSYSYTTYLTVLRNR